MKSIEILLEPKRKDTFKDGIKFSSPFCSTAVLLQTDDNKNIIFDTGAFGYSEKLIHALANKGLTPDDIDYVILSHSHFDHIGNIHLFKNAELIQDKWLIKISDGSSKKYIDLPKIDMPGIKLIRTPGHSEDGISLICEYNGKTYALVGDAIKTEAINYGAIKRKLCSNAETYLETMKTLFRETDVIISGDDGIISGEHFERLKGLVEKLGIE